MLAKNKTAFLELFCLQHKNMEDNIEVEKGVETAELWVERLRIAAVEHYSKHHVPQDLRIQKKTRDYVKQNITQNGSVSSEDQEQDQDQDSNHANEPLVTIIQSHVLQFRLNC